ncbi:MAG TPA: DNA repair protein RecO [Saprospiraceae bacterium]|nr:DNA repair protein RecO [Saprospiraceae bacterium]
MLKTRGIVFRSVKYGETSVIADIFTEEKGLCSFIGGGVRSAKAKMPYNLFQPMTVVELVAYHREGSGSSRLKEMRASEVWTSIPFDLKHGAVALFMAEVCRKAIHEEEEHRELFDFILENLHWLDSTPHPLANLHLHFLLALSGYLGFQPLPPDTAGEVFFDLREGIFSPAPPPHTLIMEPDQVQQMLFLMDNPLETVHELSLTRAQRKALLVKLLQYYQLHLPGFREVHTPEILEMVM